jgi:predicted molibdopterin-dependent oxidoreductase YjgC
MTGTAAPHVGSVLGERYLQPTIVNNVETLAGARTVVAVDRFLTPSAGQADVVLAAAGFGEVDGTTTNIEGRVSTVARKITPPGTARADWMIAAELARLLGADLGLTSADEIATEIEALAPSHAGLTAEVLAGPAAHDGVVVPLADAGSGRPAVLGYVAGARPPVPAVDAYSLRLVATRKLYDMGTATQTSPSLAGLAPGSGLRLHPHDFDRVGVAAGASVTITSATGSATLPLHADPGVPRGSAAVVVSQPGAEVGAIIDATASVIDVRVQP